MRTTSIDNHTCAYASPSHPGGVQQHNQDRWLADRFQGLFIVSDDISGSLAGELVFRGRQAPLNLCGHLFSRDRSLQ